MKEIKLIDARSAQMVLEWNLVGDNADVASRLLDTVPAIDAVPVVHGRWIDCEEDPNEKYCSVCNHERNACNSWWNYCPNCGAQMDEDGDK